MSAADIKNLQITATSISVDVAAHGIIHTLSIFGPDLKTMRSLQRLHKNDMITGMELIDQFDDGTQDTHSTKNTYEVVCCVNGDRRKQQTVTLVLIDYDAMIRRPSYGE